MAKLTFLGAGSAFSFENGQSNAMYQGDNGKNLLIDCGSDIRHLLNKNGLSHLDVHAVYISHLHADHVGGLEYLGYMSMFDPAYVGKPTLYIHERLYPAIWDNCLKGGMQKLQDGDATLDTFFNVKTINHCGLFDIDGTMFSPFEVPHVGAGKSYGLLFNLNDKNVFFTSDTRFDITELMEPYIWADVIFHDCETAYKSGVHAHFDELRELPQSIRQKMWLYHYNDGQLPELTPSEGFCGFVNQGHTFE